MGTMHDSGSLKNFQLYYTMFCIFLNPAFKPKIIKNTENYAAMNTELFHCAKEELNNKGI